MKRYIGASTWSQKDWIGNFYPPKTKPADFLIEYSKRLPTVEIDSTFYAVPKPAVVEAWHQKTPPEFVFSAKLPKIITHEKHLRHCAEEISLFLSVMSLLKEKLGAILIQLPPDFVATLETVETMKQFLQSLPTSEFCFALEVRHRSWLKEKFFERLRLHRVALALTDLPVMNHIFLQTAPFVYARWLGDRAVLSEPFTKLELDKTEEMTLWAKRISGLQAEHFFGYFNNHYAGHSPSSVAAFNQILSETEKGGQVEPPFA